MQVGVSPAWVPADAVQADHAAAFVGELQGLRSAHGLEERVQVALQLGHEGVVVATPEETEKVMHACCSQDKECTTIKDKKTPLDRASIQSPLI